MIWKLNKYERATKTTFEVFYNKPYVGGTITPSPAPNWNNFL